MKMLESIIFKPSPGFPNFNMINLSEFVPKRPDGSSDWLGDHHRHIPGVSDNQKWQTIVFGTSHACSREWATEKKARPVSVKRDCSIASDGQESTRSPDAVKDGAKSKSQLINRSHWGTNVCRQTRLVLVRLDDRLWQGFPPSRSRQKNVH
jgi:hypothetical protein